MSARCFSMAEKSTIFANFTASVCFAEHQYISIECKIYMDFNGSSGNSYNNRNPALGVLWSWHRVASPPIEIPIQIWKKKFADKLHKSYKKHPCQTSPTFSGHFTLQAEQKINWNNYISMVLYIYEHVFPTKSAFTKKQTTKMAVVMITGPMRSR